MSALKGFGGIEVVKCVAAVAYVASSHVLRITPRRSAAGPGDEGRTDGQGHSRIGISYSGTGLFPMLYFSFV